MSAQAQAQSPASASASASTSASASASASTPASAVRGWRTTEEPRGPRGFEVPLWRALAVFRIAAVAFSAAVAASRVSHFTHPFGAASVTAVIVLWTAFSAYRYIRPARRIWPLLAADLVVTCGCVLVTRLVLPEGEISATLPMLWIASPVIAWAIAVGRRGAAFAAAAIECCSVYLRGRVDTTALSEAALLLLAGIAIAHMAVLAGEAEARLQEAAEAQAAARERDRLARGIHDSVLQVLALVQRRATELGGEAAELGRLAGEQEAALRVLVAAETDTGGPKGGGTADLRAALLRMTTPRVSLAAPAVAVPLPALAVSEIAAAVGAALDNVTCHVGPEARAWLLLEDEGNRVVVTVRDEGPGIAPGRLEEAAEAGRLGVASSIRGRIADLGGAVEISSAPGQGTEIEIRVPRS